MKKFFTLCFLLALVCVKSWGQTVTFNYTGSNQTFTVPAGVTSLTVKLWGAGGAGGDYGSGGSGSFVTGILTVTPGQLLTIVVGQGGGIPTSTISTTTVGYGGGGGGGYVSTGYTGGGGGGRSTIQFTAGTDAVTAGAGGGGGGYYYGSGYYYPRGGGGGATDAYDGYNGASGTYAGKAGSVTTGGAAGSTSIGTSPTAGSSLKGGYGGTYTYCGGGGGGGYFGGGGGSGSGSGAYCGGGGGGSSYTGYSSFSGTNTAGSVGNGTSTTTAPGNADASYVSGVGTGGSYSPAAGGNGEVVITYVVSTPTLTANPTSLAFGNACLNTSPAVQSTTITGSNLTTAPIAVGPLTGYTFSKDNTTYSASLSLTHPAGSYSQAIYVKFTPTAVTTYNGNIPVSGGGATTINVAVTGTGVNSPPTATSGSASNVTSSSATVAGSLTAGCSTTTAYGIEYSTTAGFANGSGTQASSNNLSGGAFSSNLTGLAASTTYYFHAYATGGTTVYGTQGSFITAITPPANDNCSTAFSIIPSASCTATSGTSAGATQQYAPAACSGFTSSAALDVWYQFTADGSSSYTINVTGNGSFDPVLQLFSGCSTGSAISCIDATSSGGTETTAAGVLAAGTYYYRIYDYNGSTGTFTTCVTAPFTYIDSWISLSSGSTTWCAGETRNVNVTVKNTGTATWVSGSTGVNLSYYWSNQTRDQNPRIMPFTGAGLAPGHQQTITVPVTATSAGTYTLNFDLVKETFCWFGDNSTGCSGPGNVVYVSPSQTINAQPAALTVTPATATICSGSIQQLTASGGSISTSTAATALSQNFDAGNLPAGWARSNSGGTGYSDFPNSNEVNSSGDTWPSSPAGYGGTGYCMYFYSFLISSGGTGYLETPAMDLSSYSTAMLTFYIYNSGGTDVLNVYAKQGSGSYAQVNTSAYGVYGNWTQITINLSSYIGTGFNAVKIKFQGTSDNGSSNIGIDNVVVSGTTTSTSQAPITWAPTTNLYTDAGATTAYTAGTNLATVYAKPTATTTYTATATNATCTASGTSVITVNPLPTASVAINPTAICSGNTALVTINGTPKAAVSYTVAYAGITSPRTDTLNSIGSFAFTTPVLNTNSIANYVVTIKSVTAPAATGGCSITPNSTYNLTVNPLPTAGISGTTTVCQNGTAPSITFTGANGTAPYTFTYTVNGGGNQTITTTSGNSVTVSQATTTANTYTYALVSVKDASATTCSSNVSGSATVTVNPLPTATISASSAAACQNSASPVITFTGAGGTAPYTFTYTINGVSQTPITCSGTNSSVTLPVSTSTVTTYTYSLVSVKDGSTTACSNAAGGSATVTINALPSAPTVTVSQPTCATATGAITITAPTGTGYTYSIDGTTYVTSTTFSGLAANTTYTVYVKNSNGCIAASSATINSQPPSPSAPATTVTQPTCATATGTITVTSPSGTGYTYSINGTTYQSSATFSGIATGSYTVYVMNSSNCIATSSATVNAQPATPTASISYTGSPYCTTGTATVTQTGQTGGTYTSTTGLSINSSNGTINLYASTAGTYTVTYSFNNGTCSNTTATSVTVNALPQVFNLTSGTFTACYDGSNAPDLTLSGSESGVTYKLLRGATVVNTVTGNGSSIDFGTQGVGGTYTATANNGSCSTNMGGSATVNVAPQIIVYMVTGSGTFCGQATVTLSGSQSGVTYNLLNNGASTGQSPMGTGNPLSFTVTSSGSYTIFATAGNCNNGMNGTAAITINPVPVIANKTSTAACGGAFSLTPTNGTDIVPNGTTYTWSAPSGTGFTGGAAGNNQSSVSGTLTNTTNAAVTAIYTVTPTAGSCPGSSFTVTVTVNPVPSIANKTTAICSSNAFSVTPANGTDIVPGGTTYTWSMPVMSAGISGGAAGSGSSITGTLTNSSAAAGTATYTVTPTAGSCSGSSFTVTVTVNSSTVITGNPTSAAYCKNATAAALNVTATGTGTLTYQWFSNNTNSNTGGAQVGTGSTYTPSTAAAGTVYYYVTVTGSCGNATSLTAGITVNDLPTASISGTTTVCQNTTAPLVTFTGTTGTAPYTFTYNVNSGSNQTITTASGNTSVTVSQATATPGAYTYKLVSVQDASSTACTNPASGTATVTVNPNATIALASAAGTDNQTLCINTALTNITYNIGGGGTGAGVTGLPAGVTGAYNNGVFTISGTPTASGTFNYTVTTTGGCAQTSASGSITVKPDATIVLATGSGAASQSSCAGAAINTITYTIGGGGTGATVSNLPAGLTSSVNGTTVTISGTPTASDTYTVITTGTCTQATTQGTITVNALPTAHISNYNNTICTNSTALVQVTGTPGSTITYSFPGDSQTSATVNSSGILNYTTPALNAMQSPYSTYTFMLTGVSSGGGCSAMLSDAAPIQVYPYANAGLISGGNVYVAKGDTVHLSSSGDAGGIWSSNNSGIATVTNNGAVADTVIATGAGTATITYTVTNDAKCASSATTLIHVYDQNTADYITTNNGNFSNSANWKFPKGDGTYIPATAPPSSSNSVLVEHNLIMDVNYTVGAGKSFIIDNSPSFTPSFTVAPGKVFTVLGAADFNGKPVVVRSDISGTAQIGGTTVISNASKVTVERYIPLTTTNLQGTNRAGRAWRLITSPISDVTINQAWQENVLTVDSLHLKNPSPGYGTNITGTMQYTAGNANAHGFDFWPAIGNKYSSIRVYHGAPLSANENWADTTSILNVKISSYPAYLLFVRGDRNQFSPPDASKTTLRATGILQQVQAVYPVYDANKQSRSVIGNPYAATLDFDKILSDNSALIKPQYWRWDAANGTYGGYTLVQKSGGSYITVPYPFTSGTGTPPSSTTAQYIESGEGFLVEPATGSPGGLLSIVPAHKATAGATASPFRIVPPPVARMFINLNLYSALDSSSALADGVMASFNDDAGSSDAAKPYNFNENLGLDKDSGILTVLAHPALITAADTLHLRLWNTAQRSYQLQVKAENWQAAGLEAYLLDNYLHTTAPLSLSGDVSTVTFAVSSDAASASQHRFAVVFSPAVLPVTLTKVTASKKSDGSVNVDWQVAGETGIKEYTVERSFDGHDFVPVATVAAGSPTGSYSVTDHSPGSSDNYYRIRIVSSGGTVSYSAIVKVSFSAIEGKTLIALYPNPVQEGMTAYLKVENLAAGAYNAVLYTTGGQRVQVSVIAHSGGSAVIAYPMPRILAQGKYTLGVFGKDKKQITALPVVVVKK